MLLPRAVQHSVRDAAAPPRCSCPRAQLPAAGLRRRQRGRAQGVRYRRPCVVDCEQDMEGGAAAAEQVHASNVAATL
jgi:hypothetical protein